MEVAIQDAGRRNVVLAVSLLAAALVIFQAGEIWLADRRIHSGESQEIERGAALLPGNGEAWDRLGRAIQWDLANANPSAAIEDYRKAVQVDPLSEHYWMDLASAYEAVGEEARARDAFAHAKAVYPSSAEVAWYYGNFLLRQRDYAEAYGEIDRAVSSDASLLPLAISRSWRSGVDVNQLLDHVLPANVDAYSQALDFLSSIQQTDAGLVVWKRLLAMGKPVNISRTFPFFDELIREDRSDDARRIWPQALAAAGLPWKQAANHSVIWNGDFGSDFVNGGLDWRWEPIPDATIYFDWQQPPGGVRAVRLDFEGGTNLDLHAPFQYVPVEPNQSYHFHAYMRTQGITTESGIRFSVIDPNHPAELNAGTHELIGSRAWTALDTDLKTGADTHFVLVRLLRSPSRLFENRLSGTAWIADVSLIPSNTAPEKPSP